LEILEKLINEDGYRFGEPWRTSSKALSFVVPIIQEAPSSSRNYYVIEEVKDKITIEDTGHIGEVRVKGDVGKPVFFRGGGVLEGVGTQSRAVKFDIVVVPQREETIKVLCVHASHPISTGRRFRVRGVAPRPIFMALARGDQYATWSAVSNYSRAVSNHSRTLWQTSATSPRTGTTPFYSDNLVTVMETVERFREDVKKKLEKIPATLQNQVGVVVIDAKGVVGLELFDHPESWKVFSNSIMRHYEDVLIEEAEADIFKLDEQKIVPTIKNFLKKAKNCKEEQVWRGEVGTTYALKGNGIVGQYTTIKDKTIHLILAREEKTESPPEMPTYRILYADRYTSEGTSTTSTTSDLPRLTWEYTLRPPQRYFERRGAYTFLDEISERPKTWRELEPKFRSPVTLSRRMKEAVRLGLAEKTIRPTNGRTVYRITDKGKLWLAKAKKEAVKYY